MMLHLYTVLSLNSSVDLRLIQMIAGWISVALFSPTKFVSAEIHQKVSSSRLGLFCLTRKSGSCVGGIK